MKYFTFFLIFAICTLQLVSQQPTTAARRAACTVAEKPLFDVNKRLVVTPHSITWYDDI